MDPVCGKHKHNDLSQPKGYSRGEKKNKTNPGGNIYQELLSYHPCIHITKKIIYNLSNLQNNVIRINFQSKVCPIEKGTVVFFLYYCDIVDSHDLFTHPLGFLHWP